MIKTSVKQKYLPTIGIECHVQLKTKTKLFAAVDNDAREAAPNTLISHICVGLPGALPVLNEAAIELSSRAALALHSEPQKVSSFERKHYFYPDLPKGYQITQYAQPIIKSGFVEFSVDGQSKKVAIERANLEEDAGKNSHPVKADYSLVDLNRAGTPLLEIVSKPELHSPTEAKAYCHELWLLMKYAGVTDGDLFHGHVRFDLNISLSSDPKKLGTRSEIKNLNSFRSIEAAVAYEIKRQAEVLKSGDKVVQETRGWDEANLKTTSQRTKEEAHDYRYMPEPDIPPVVLDDKYVEQQRKALPALPSDIRGKLRAAQVEDIVIEDVLENEAVCKKAMAALAANPSVAQLRRIIYDSLEIPESLDIPISEHIKVVAALEAGSINSTAGAGVLKKLATGTKLSAEELISQNSQLSDASELEKIVEEVLAENEKAAEDVRRGEAKAIGFLVGKVMTVTGGKANPSLVQEIIKQKLAI